MTRQIKGFITMKKSSLLTVTGGALALALAGCATSGGSKTAREPLPDEEGKSGGAAVTERETISTKQAEQIIPKGRGDAFADEVAPAPGAGALDRLAAYSGRRPVSA